MISQLKLGSWVKMMRYPVPLLEFFTKLFSIEKEYENTIEMPDVDIAWGYDPGKLSDLVKKDDALAVFGADPIAMMEAHKFKYGKYDQKIAEIADTIDRWEDLNGGRPTSGHYVFDVRVFARLGEELVSVVSSASS